MNVNQSAFDHVALANEYNVSEKLLDSIVKKARQEFGDDEMMVELHVLRAIRSSRFDADKKAVQA